MNCPYEMMQRAVDIVSASPHPTNKIAATISGTEANGHQYIISKTNYWPPAIEMHFGHDGRIGNSSGTIHAETACLLHAPRTKDASLFITDPPCPNCAKNMAEAGIKSLYIDHKGFEKDFAQRRSEAFEDMSMRIFAAAGIEVHIIHRKERRIETLLDCPTDYTPPVENPCLLLPITKPPSKKEFFTQIKNAEMRLYDGRHFALCLAEEGAGNFIAFSATSHPAVGYTHDDDLSKEGKYSFILQPLNRLLMAGKFYGLRIDPHYIFTSRTPTARELINLVGGGFDCLYVGNKDLSRDEFGLQAKDQLEKNSIVKFLNI